VQIGALLASLLAFCFNPTILTSTAMTANRTFFGFWSFSHRTGGGRG
jgi:hypothetical protein